MRPRILAPSCALALLAPCALLAPVAAGCSTPAAATMPPPPPGSSFGAPFDEERPDADPAGSSEAYRAVLEAELELQDGNVPAGIARLREAVLHDPTSAYLRVRLAEAWLEAGDAAQARAAGEEALALAPKHTGALRVVGRAWAAAGERKKARAAYERALAAAPADRDSSNLLAELLVEDGDVAAAEDVIEQLMQREPGAVDGYLSLARIFAERGELERAFVHVERALARESADPLALGMKLTLLWSEGRFSEALPAALALAKVAGGEIEVRRDLLTAHALAGALDDAETFAAAWLDEDDSEPIRLIVAEAWERAGELERAAAVLEKPVPRSPRSAADVARLHLQLGDAARAVDVVCPLVDAPADTMVSAFVLATCVRALVEPAHAGQGDAAAGDAARAKRAAALLTRRAAALGPSLGEAAPVYVDALASVARAGGLAAADALALADAALAADPAEPNTVGVVARAHEELGDVAGARRILDDALRARPSSPELLFSLARHLERQKEPLAAVEIVERLMDRGKTGIDELNFAAFALADAGVRVDEAPRLAWRALVQDPLSGYVVDTLGWAQLGSGDVDAAVRTLRRADKLVPRDGEVLFHLASALEKQGDVAAAREAATRADALLHAGEPVKARVQELLARLAAP